MDEGDTTHSNLPQSGIFWAFLPNLSSQGESLASPNLNTNPSKSSRFAVEDFKKRQFVFNQGKNGANTVRIREYFNEE